MDGKGMAQIMQPRHEPALIAAADTDLSAKTLETVFRKLNRHW
jgi:hypothetical protein